MIDRFGLFPIFKDRDLDFYMPLVDAYRRMYKTFEPLRSEFGIQATRLNATEIIEILRALVHPDFRPFLLAPSTSAIQ